MIILASDLPSEPLVTINRSSVAECAPNGRIVPPPRRDPLSNALGVPPGGQYLLGFVPSPITKPARSNDIAWLVLSAIGDWIEMLGRASEVASNLG